MRIAIDLQACQNGSRDRGIGRYALAITKAMIGLERGHDFRIILSDRFSGTILPLRRALEGVLPQAHILVCALPPRTASAEPANAWRTRAAEILRARFIADLAPDLLFVPSLFEGYWDNMIVSVERAPFPTAVTLYDFIPLDEPDLYLPTPAARDAYFRRLRDARKADLLLAISGHVADQAAARLDVPPARIVTTPLGVDPAFRPPGPDNPDRPAVMGRHGITRPYVLNASPFEPRKNIPALIAAFGRLPAALRDAHQLVLVGRMNADAQRAIATHAASAGLASEAIVLAGFVADADLVALYGHAALFAFPSLSEGFGLPILEAMACGAPVIGSATTSIPEIVGRADLLCDPTDPAAIAAGMARVLDDPALQADLRRYGPARAAGFTWRQTAATTLDAFERIAADRTAPRTPARAPPPERAKLAFVVAAMDDPGGPAAMLFRGLADRMACVLICADPAALPAFATLFEVRDRAWFARHAPAFDHILYVEAVDAAWLGDLMDAFPGVLLAHDAVAAAPPAALMPAAVQRDLIASGGVAALIAAVEGTLTPAEIAARRGTALRAKALGVVTISEAGDGIPRLAAQASPADIAHAADLLRRALVDFAATAPPNPRRLLADALPRSVGGILPNGTDLAKLAIAYEQNIAHRRAPANFLDVSVAAGGAPGRWPRLIAALKAGPAMRPVREAGDRFVDAIGWVGTAIGLDAAHFPEEPIAFRPGDRIFRDEDESAPSSKATLRAEEAGARFAPLR